MLSSDLSIPVANGYFFLANVLSAARIDKVVVPEIIQSGSNITLDCQYSVPGDDFTLMWFSNNNESPLYSWSPNTMPVVSDVIKGYIDLSYKISEMTNHDRRALRILKADSDLSGEYTCVLSHRGVQRRQSKSMLIYSPEEEIDITIKKHLRRHLIEIRCVARGLYPQPDMVLEYNNEPIPQQSQRVWHHTNLYNVEGKAQLTLVKEPNCKQNSEVTCRIFLPQADYTAIKKKVIYTGDYCSKASRWKSTLLSIIVMIHFLNIFK